MNEQDDDISGNHPAFKEVESQNRQTRLTRNDTTVRDWRDSNTTSQMFRGELQRSSREIEAG